MAKQYNIESILSYSWEQVVSAFWLRYPNPYSHHVLTEDVIDRFIDADGCLHTRRLFKKTNSMPRWVAAIIPTTPKSLWIVEDSVCDYENKTHISRCVNVGYKNIGSLTETNTFSQSNPLATLWHRHAAATSNLFGVASALKMFAIERYKRNADKTLNGFGMVLSQLYGNAAIANEPSEFAKRLHRLEKLRQSWQAAVKAGKGKGEKLVHSGLGAAGVQFEK